MNQKRKDAWTGAWLADQLQNHDRVINASTISSNRVKIQRKSGDEYEVATISLQNVQKNDLLEILNLELGTSFVTNISRDAYYHGNALELAVDRKIILGNMGDLFRAINLDNPLSYIDPNVKFILRGLRQHHRINHVRRLDDSRYQIERIGLKSVIVLAIYDYDLSADSIRNGLDRYGDCHAILAANPNCQLTTLAKSVAKSTGIKIYKWAELLGALNRSWS